MTTTDDSHQSVDTPRRPDGGVATTGRRSVLDRFGDTVRTVGLIRGETRDIELRSRLGTFRAELDALEARLEESSVDTSRLDICRDQLQDATDLLRAGRLEEAWGQYRSATRLVVFVYEALGDETALTVRARVTYEEASEALGGSPRRTVVGLLTDGGQLRSPPTATELAEAMRVLHDQYERVALTRRYLQSQFNQLLLQGCSSLALLFLIAAAAAILSLDRPPGSVRAFSFLTEANILVSPLNPGDPGTDATNIERLQTVGFALHVVLVGLLGASVFGMRSLRDQPLTTQAVRRTPGLFVTGARAFIGATSALFLVFVLFTGLVNNEAIVNAPLALAVAFAGGYSERLAPQAVDAVSQVVPSREGIPTGDALRDAPLNSSASSASSVSPESSDSSRSGESSELSDSSASSESSDS